MISVNWKGGMAFYADVPSGNGFTMDAIPQAGGSNQGPSPVEALLSSVAACSAMDVISILEKKRQIVNSYRIEVEWTRPPEGEYPRPVLAILVRHVLGGDHLDRSAVAKAIELSDTKYCSVMATLRHAPPVTTEFKIEE